MGEKSRGVLLEIVIGIFVAVIAGLIVWKLTTPPPTSTTAALPGVKTQQRSPTEVLPKAVVGDAELTQQITHTTSMPPPPMTKEDEQGTLRASRKDELPDAAFPTGSWIGTLTQADNAPSTAVLMVFNSSGSGRFVLEALNCGGSFALGEARNAMFFYSYQYEYGTGCEPGGTVRVERSGDNTLEVTAYRSTGVRMSWGRLHRIDQ